MTEVDRVRYDFGGVISDLKDEVARLEKEADWLAHQAAINCPSAELEEKCTHTSLGKDKCRKCWREAAKEAVGE